MVEVKALFLLHILRKMFYMLYILYSTTSRLRDSFTDMRLCVHGMNIDGQRLLKKYLWWNQVCWMIKKFVQ